MSATFDATTTGEYSAATTAAARSAVIVAALTGTISVKVFNGSNTEMGSGTMAAPWATSSGNTVLIGEVSSFTVGTTGTPDADWYIRFQNAGATRWVRGLFGLAGSGQDFTWSLDTWTATHTGTIGTATIITSGNAPPAFTVAPTTKSLPSSGGTIQFTAVDPEGVAVTYSMSTRTGFSISPTTGLVTVTSAAAGSTGNITVTASDGVLSTSTLCAVTVSAASGATFTIPAATTNYNASAVQPGDTIVIEGDSNGDRGPLRITGMTGSSAARITVRNPTTKAANIGATARSSYILEINNSSYVTIDGSAYSGATYGIKVTLPSASSSATSLVKFTGVVNHITMRNFEIDGKETSWTSALTPTGLSAQDKTQLRSSQDWREDYIFEDFYVHNIAGEGMYIGNNFSDGCIPSRNMIVRNGIVSNCGRDGIQGKGWWEGTNAVYGCTVTNCGRNTADPEAGQRFGISVLSGTADVYNNIVTDIGESGIQIATQTGPVAGTNYPGYGTYTTFECEAYNNVVARTGLRDDANANTGHGITSTALSGALPTKVYAYNNTIVDVEGSNINFASSISSASIAQNNILLGTGSPTSNGPGATMNNNVTTGTLTAGDVFVNAAADNYHLAAEQAITAGLQSAVDIENRSRSGTASKGAYEYA